MAVASTSAKSSSLSAFSEPTRRWFEASFEAPTPAQEQGWPAIVSGANALISAPTGSGKTLAAFLWGIDRLAREPESLGQGVRIVYISPLKALSYDVERNLRAPLKGIGADVSVGLRTGDTPQRERQAMRRKPPDILITTPESLYHQASRSGSLMPASAALASDICPLTVPCLMLGREGPDRRRDDPPIAGHVHGGNDCARAGRARCCFVRTGR